MIYLAGEPDDIWWDGEVKEVHLGADLVWKSGPTVDVYDISLTGMAGRGSYHPFVNLSPPPGETWHVTIEGTLSVPAWATPPTVHIGARTWTRVSPGAIRYEGEVTSSSSRVGLETLTSSASGAASFTGTVTVTHP